MPKFPVLSLLNREFEIGCRIATERPSHLNRDEAGHLHCEVGPAIHYPSGWSGWHWQRVPVPQTIIEGPRPRSTAKRD
jgi:hypothetical protein